MTGPLADDAAVDEGAESELARLRAEVARLHREVMRLREQNDALLAAANARDYERPPHYR